MFPCSDFCSFPPLLMMSSWLVVPNLNLVSTAINQASFLCETWKDVGNPLTPPSCYKDYFKVGNIWATEDAERKRTQTSLIWLKQSLWETEPPVPPSKGSFSANSAAPGDTQPRPISISTKKSKRTFHILPLKYKNLYLWVWVIPHTSINKLCLFSCSYICCQLISRLPTTELKLEKFSSQHNHFCLSSRVKSHQPFTTRKEIIIENISTQSKNARKLGVSST